MSLLNALAEAVVGVSAAKGGSGMLGRDGGLDSLFGQAQAAPGKGGAGLEDMLGAILGGQGGGGQGGGLGGLGGLLEQLAPDGGQGGGLESLIGQLAGGSGGGGQGGALGGLLGAVTGALGQSGGGAAGGGSSFGSVLNSAIAARGKPEARPEASPAQEAAAGLMLRAMLQAAKADGTFDQAEQDKILSRLGDVSSAERQFVNDELRKPVDVEGLARDTPKGLEAQVYAMSVMGIDLDQQSEAQYLHSLAQALGIPQNAVNGIHAKLGAPALYA